MQDGHPCGYRARRVNPWTKSNVDSNFETNDDEGTHICLVVPSNSSHKYPPSWLWTGRCSKGVHTFDRDIQHYEGVLEVKRLHSGEQCWKTSEKQWRNYASFYRPCSIIATPHIDVQMSERSGPLRGRVPLRVFGVLTYLLLRSISRKTFSTAIRLYKAPLCRYIC